MAWNESGKDDNDSNKSGHNSGQNPGDGDKDRDPWGSSGNGNSPPDLDEVVRNMQDKITKLFGGKKSSRPSGTGKKGGGNANAGFIGLLILGLIAYAGYNMVHIIDEPERGVVLRFGKYVTTIQPGLNVRLPPPIEYVYKVNVRRVQPVKHQASMLTRDENIVDIDMAVQYRIDEAKEYLFNVNLPDFTLKQVVETSVREVIGRSDMDFILTEGRTKIESDTKTLMQKILNEYRVGLVVESVNMQSAKPPEEAKSAFDDVIKAREDRERLVNQAEAYRNGILPQARGEAARRTEDALAYEAEVTARALGEASRFEQLLSAYEKAPAVTRERLYLDSMQSVLVRNKKIFMDTGKGDNILYLPLDGVGNQQLPKPVFRSEQDDDDMMDNSSSSSGVDSRSRERGTR